MRLFARLTAFAALFALPATAAAVESDPIPIEHFAVRNSMSQAQVSPDGKHLAYLTIQSRDGNPFLEIRQIDNLGAEPIRLAADPMEFTSISWVADDFLLFTARQKVRNKIDGFNQGIYESKVGVYDLVEEEFRTFETQTSRFGATISVANVLPGSPDEVLLSIPLTNAGGADEDPFESFRPRQYYRVNLRTGRDRLVYKGNNRIATATFDAEGNPRFAAGYERGRQEFVFYTRKPGEEQWDESFTLDPENFFEAATTGIVGFDPDDESIYYMLSPNGEEYVSLWEYNIDTKSFGEKIFGASGADVGGTIGHSNSWMNPEEIVGAWYYGEKPIVEWFATPGGDEHAAFDEAFMNAIPNGHFITPTSRSRDGETWVINNVGPRDPGSFYLLKNGELSFLGSANPLVNGEQLADVEYIKYPSRHGDLMIPGYLTVPNTPGPHPLVVVPHGGPYVSEVILYDEWGQLLASRGYMVLQPQYRGSLGHGRTHYMTTWAQHGLAMQDDKDDGALYLIEEGRVDPDRVAMFGWSYGGYAALVAASRDPNIYQCVVAGAAVADPDLQLSYYRSVLLPAEERWEVQRRAGINPMKEIEKINVPMFLVHGAVDQRVPFEHMRKYEPRLRRAGVDYEFMKLEGADHFFNTLFYDHFMEFYPALINYLETDCGPGGL